MNFGNIRSAGLNQQRFKGDYHRRAFRPFTVSGVKHFLDGSRKTTSFFFCQQILICIDDIAGLVDLPQPEKIVPWRPGLRGFCRLREIGASQNAQQGKHQDHLF